MTQFDCQQPRPDPVAENSGVRGGLPVAAGTSGPRVEIRPGTREDVMVITVTGALDALTAPRVDEAITNALRVPSVALIVDLSTLDFLASAGMAVLLSGHRAVEGSKRFCVVAAGPVTERPMKVIGLDRELRLYPTLDAAFTDLD